MNKTSVKPLPLIISILIAQAAGIVGSFFTASSVSTWYVDLALPAVAPPSWVFAPVWITLYALMGVAAYLIWRRRGTSLASDVPWALAVYGVHLVFNALWSIIFFGLHNPGLALIEILILLLLIVLTTVLFWRIDRCAGWLLVPYMVWVTFATYLNYAIWMLN